MTIAILLLVGCPLGYAVGWALVWLRDNTIIDTVAVPMILVDAAAVAWCDTENYIGECNVRLTPIAHHHEPTEPTHFPMPNPGERVMQ